MPNAVREAGRVQPTICGRFGRGARASARSGGKVSTAAACGTCYSINSASDQNLFVRCGGLSNRLVGARSSTTIATRRACWRRPCIFGSGTPRPLPTSVAVMDGWVDVLLGVSHDEIVKSFRHFPPSRHAFKPRRGYAQLINSRARCTTTLGFDLAFTVSPLGPATFNWWGTHPAVLYFIYNAGQF